MAMIFSLLLLLSLSTIYDAIKGSAENINDQSTIDDLDNIDINNNNNNNNRSIDSEGVISGSDSQITNASVVNNTADYTFMVYMVGSDMTSATANDIAEMKSVGSNSDVNIILETGGGDPQDIATNKEMIDFHQLQRHKILNNSIQTLSNLGYQNMGDPRILSDFITWGMSEFPAKKYTIILWDHGSGINGFGGDLLFDNDKITLNEIEKAFADAKKVTNKKFELIGFDACLMASIEVANKIKSYGNYMISSEEIEPSWGWDYSKILRNLTKYPSQDGLLIGKTIADTFVKHSRTIAASQRFDAQKDVTLSLINLTRISGLVEDLGILSDSLVSRINDIPAVLSLANSIDLTERYGRSTDVSPDAQGSSGLVDIYDLASNLQVEFPEMSDVIEKVQKSLNNSVVYNVNGDAKPNAHGLSVYMPSLKDEFTDSAIINSLDRWKNIINLQQELIKTDKEPPIVESDLVERDIIRGHVYSGDVSSVDLVIYALLPEGNRIFHQELDPKSFIKSDGSFEYKWNNQIISLCNNEICRPASMEIEVNKDKKFALIPVRLESYADNHNRIVSLNYEIQEEGGYSFLGATREIKEEGSVPKEKLPLFPKDKVHTLAYSFNWNDFKSDYDINFVNYDPMKVTENFGPKYVTYNGTFTVHFDVCDYSSKCWSTRDIHFNGTSKLEVTEPEYNAPSCDESKSSDMAGNLSTYINPLYGFRMQYPYTWEKIERGIPDPGVVQFVLPPEANLDGRSIIVSIYAYYNSYPISLKKSIDNYINTVKAFNPLSKLIESNATNLGGIPAYKVVHVSGDGPLKSQTMHIRAIVGDKVYYIELLSSPTNLQEHFLTLDKMLKSFRFCESKGKIVAIDQYNNHPSSQYETNNIKTNQDKISVDNLSTYINPLYGFRMQYPSNWTTEENENKSQVAFKSTYERKRNVSLLISDKFAEQLIIYLNPKFLTSRESPERALDELINTLKEIRIGFNIVRMEQTIVKGNLAYELVWIDFDPELRTQLKHMGIVTIIYGNLYFFEYIAESSNYDRYFPIIEKMINSLDVYSIKQ
jgi:hypothetical protein